jgi:hypothetical protein
VLIVLGSRYDPAAGRMVELLPGAALCAAEDLTRRGWAWHCGGIGHNRWVVGGVAVDDDDVTGVLVRRSGVFAEELVGTHHDDREYLAAEATAFLAFVLTQTKACVINPVRDGAIGEEAVRLEHWLPIVEDLGITAAPLRVSAKLQTRPAPSSRIVEVVAKETFGAGTQRLRQSLVYLADRLGLVYAAFMLDADDRLQGVSTMNTPSADALPAVAELLEGYHP